MSSSYSILVISTGGTIGGHVVSTSENSFRPSLDTIEDLLPSTVNYLNYKYDLSINIEHYSYCDMDSSNILPKDWTNIANYITDNYDLYDSFIVTHGTNTLGYTSAALSFALVNVGKPVILTGSQVPAGWPVSDATSNLMNALRLAVWNDGHVSIKGVITVFGSHIIAGTRVKKDTEFDYDAFKSFNVGSIGRIGRVISINNSNLTRHISYLSNNIYPTASSRYNLICESNFDARIASLTEYPGMNPDILKLMVTKEYVKGIILRSFGAGDPCMRHMSVLEELKDREIPVVVTTQAPNGNSNFQVNQSGRVLRENRLAIPAYDMNIESQTVKLAWLLAKKNNGEMTYKQLCSQMTHDMRGEISVMWEIG